MSTDEITSNVLDELDPRYRRLGRLVIGMLIALVIGAAILAYTVAKAQQTAHRAEHLTAELAALVREQQAQRQRNSLDQCQRTNADHANLRLFIQQVAPGLLARARVRFPPLARDCAAYAARRVTTTAPTKERP